MARSLASTSSQSLYQTASIPTYPYTLACWIHPTSDAIMAPMSVLDAGGDGRNYDAIILLSSGFGTTVRAQSSDAASLAVFAVTSTTWTINAWNHVVAVFAAANDRRIYVNGGGKGTETSSRSPTMLSVEIGCSSTGAPTFARGNYFNGRIGEATVFNVALSDDEVASLYNNGIAIDPSLVRPDAIANYWRMLQDDGDVNYWTQTGLSTLNSPTYGDHPPALYPGGILDVIKAGAVAPSASTSGNLLLLGVG